MKVTHLSLTKTNSTQLDLKNYIKEKAESKINSDVNILVSTSEQSDGFGRFGRRWDNYKNALAFSFTLQPNKIKTLTSLEIAILISEFFKNKYEVKLSLKWPNDILNKNEEKCAGILMEFFNEDLLIVGVGINLFKSDEDEMLFQKKKYLTPSGYVFSSPAISGEFKKEIPLEIYNYILENRKESKQIIDEWNELSVHINRLVKIVDEVAEETREEEGVFLGVGPSGEALLGVKKEIRSIFTGSLVLLS
ncbi:MAG: biotin--[acetyl-CoA-carboxylase] ligase [Oligoflexia bacterium]|nr:biotin--[acetyl-CoA-carboxylase] ligase [Oligoflexia bacterium]